MAHVRYKQAGGEDAVFDNINDYYYYLNSFFQYTNKRFDYMNGSYEYGACVWFHYLETKYQYTGGPGHMVKSIWESLVNYSSINAIDVALRSAGSTFFDDLVEFYAWNFFTGSRADPDHYYPEGAFYPEMHMDGRYIFSSDTAISQSIYPTAARFYRFTLPSQSDVAFIPVNLNSYPFIGKMLLILH